MASVQKRPNGSWPARYRDDAGKEHARHFPRKLYAQRWLDEVTAAVITGAYVSPKLAKTTVSVRCDSWLEGYAVPRSSTVRQARTHVKRIKAHFGDRPLSAIKPSHVKKWIAALKAEGLADSTVYALHSRRGQILGDAVHDGLIPRSPVSRRTSPGAAKQRAYVATTEQVWAFHDALPEHFRPVVLLGAFAALRVAEIAALRVADVDFMRGIIPPAIQYPADPLKTDMSKTAITIPQSLALALNRVPATWGSETLVVGGYGRAVAPYTIERAFAVARETVDGLPAGFRIHDLRHYYASLLIASGLDVEVVQARLRHASAKTTLDVYGHLWPDTDESSRAAIAGVLTEGAEILCGLCADCNVKLGRVPPRNPAQRHVCVRPRSRARTRTGADAAPSAGSRSRA